jgi:hypothetical protein
MVDLRHMSEGCVVAKARLHIICVAGSSISGSDRQNCLKYGRRSQAFSVFQRFLSFMDLHLNAVMGQFGMGMEDFVVSVG